MDEGFFYKDIYFNVVQVSIDDFNSASNNKNKKIIHKHMNNNSSEFRINKANIALNRTLNDKFYYLLF